MGSVLVGPESKKRPNPRGLRSWGRILPFPDLIAAVGLASFFIGILALFDHLDIGGDEGFLGALRIIVGIPVFLVFPGYLLACALWPRKNDMDGLERIALTLGFSVLIVVLIGIGLNFSPFGIGLVQLGVSLLSVTAGLGVIAWVRRIRLPSQDRFSPDLLAHLPPWSRLPMQDRIVAALSVVLLISGIVAIAIVVTSPPSSDQDTEIFFTSGDGTGFPPETIVVNESLELEIHVINHEHRMVDFELELTWNDRGLNVSEIVGTYNFTLDHGEPWNTDFRVYAGHEGVYRIEALLTFDGGTSEMFIQTGLDAEA